MLKVLNFLFKSHFFLTGESDAKVLTLAEQIIAAMPDRIKVCIQFTFSGHLLNFFVIQF